MSFWKRIFGKEEPVRPASAKPAPIQTPMSSRPAPIQPAAPAAPNDILIKKIHDWRDTPKAERVKAMQQLFEAGDPRLTEVLTKAYLDSSHDEIRDPALALLERIGTDAVPGIARGLQSDKTEERCARILGRIGGAASESALEEALREAQAQLETDPAGVFVEHLVNALEVIRDPKAAGVREKREAANDSLIAIIDDGWAKAEPRIAAIHKFAKSGDSRLLRVMTLPFQDGNMGGDSGKVIDAALSVLQGLGEPAVPAIASYLPATKAAETLGLVGGPQAVMALEKAIDNYGRNQSPRPAVPPNMANALQKIRNPAAAAEREQREAAERKIYERTIQTRDLEQAVAGVFGELFPTAPLLSSQECDAFFKDWAGGSTSGIGLKRGSVPDGEAVVRTQLKALAGHAGFEKYSIELNPRWKCVFVKTFYGGVVNFLLVWRQQDGCVVAHT